MQAHRFGGEGPRDLGAVTLKSDIRAEADRLRAGFEARGAAVFEADILQHAGALLNLYGEDIRARAFVTQDPLKGEMMLRPDFTVPLVQRHLEMGAKPAVYTYAGEVFRRQEEDENRPSEYIQVGYERIGDADTKVADADVFKAFSTALGDLPVVSTIGDLGLIESAVRGLDTPQRRKDALLRHIWRPTRFNALLDRFSIPAQSPPLPPDPDLPHVGLRSRKEISQRIAVLAEEAETPPLSQADVGRLRGLMAIKDSLPKALERLEIIADGSASVTQALDGFRALCQALKAQGIDTTNVMFDATFGLTTLEYYTGFVFGFAAPGYAPVATGGRYDLLTRALSDGRHIPAVGGVIRPEIALDIRGGGA